MVLDILAAGILANDESPYVINYKGRLLQFELSENKDHIEVHIDSMTAHDYPDFVKHLKNVFRKAACCVGCQECQADCPHGYLSFKDGNVVISDNCYHCSQCHKAEDGCLVYKSLELPKGGIIMSGKNMSLNSYSHHAPKMNWINQFFEYKNDFDEKNNLGSQMYSFFKRFLRDARLIDKNGFTTIAELVERLGLDTVI